MSHYPTVVTGTVAVVLGGMILGVAVTLLMIAWRWALGMDPTVGRQLARVGMGVTATILVLVGLILLTNGAEGLAGYPLGRWSGASMVVDLWIALELMTRELVVAAALSRRRAVWAVAAIGWVITKATQVFAAFVMLWAWLSA